MNVCDEVYSLEIEPLREYCFDLLKRNAKLFRALNDLRELKNKK